MSTRSLRKSLIGFLLLIVFTHTAGLSQERRTPPRSRHAEPLPGSLKAQAQAALAAGKDSATVAEIAEFPIMGVTVENALNKHAVVLAQLVASAVRHNDRDIVTTYKFRVLERLSRRANVPSVDILGYFRKLGGVVPDQFFPARPNELLVFRLGGTVVVDGVALTCKNPDFPDLLPGETYLLFVTSDNAVRYGTLDLGGGGIFVLVEEDGETRLQPLIDNHNGLAADLDLLYGKSLERLKQYLQ